MIHNNGRSIHYWSIPTEAPPEGKEGSSLTLGAGQGRQGRRRQTTSVKVRLSARDARDESG